MVERALRAAGHRTGLYTSPHLDRIEERVAIDGAPVDAATFEACARDVFATVDAAPRRRTPGREPHVLRSHHRGGVRGVPRAREVDVAVIEVGLGGRFDATTVIAPVAPRSPRSPSTTNVTSARPWPRSPARRPASPGATCRWWWVNFRRRLAR